MEQCTFARRFRPWETAALLALSLCLCAGVWAQARQNGISSSLVRLHVVAVSDAPEEQALKLRVRDAVLAYLSGELDAAADAAQARALLGEHLPEIAQAAASAAEGRSVQVSLRRESYPTRDYGGLLLPAGRYTSLRVVLGEGQGHNWWCVVFPPLCLSAVETEPLRSTMGRQDYALVTEEPGTRLAFRTVELWGELVEAVERRTGA